MSIPCPGDRYLPSGEVPRHYFHQDLLVANRIFIARPRKHVDVGSRIDGFVAHVAAFRPIEVLDLRPAPAPIRNVTFANVDITKVGDEYHNYCDSLSCLHALEHIGLGRYGDRIDIDGHKKGFEGLSRMLKPGGTLYLSVPIGPERIDFNAHRVLDISTILKMASDDFTLVRFDYIDDQNILHESVPMEGHHVESNFGCTFGCGIFQFRKNRRRARRS